MKRGWSFFLRKEESIGFFNMWILVLWKLRVSFAPVY